MSQPTRWADQPHVYRDNLGAGCCFAQPRSSKADDWIGDRAFVRIDAAGAPGLQVCERLPTSKRRRRVRA